MEWIQSLSSLPNLHPALVHFPIVLLLLGGGLDIVSLLVRRCASCRSFAGGVYILGGVAAWVVFYSGRMAADGLGIIPPQAQSALSEHADMAWWVVAAGTVVALARIVEFAGFLPSRITGGGPWRGLNLVAGLVAIALVSLTADRGGSLVYQHGLAVARPASNPAEVETAEPEPSSDLVIDEDGTLEWTPQATDSLYAVMEPADPAMAEAVVSLPAESGPGLPLEVRGRAILLFEPTYGDVQAEIRVDLSGFEGRIAVLHQYSGEGSMGAFNVDTASSKTSLVEISESKQEILHEKSLQLPSDGVVTLAGVTTGSHRKGFADGELVAHGHAKARPPGKVGILLDGSGRIRLLEAAVFPL